MAIAAFPPPTKAIICLHGSGTSSAIFRLQLAKLRFALKNQFEFVFVNAPNPAPAGPGVLPLFADAGPFFGWYDHEGESEDAKAMKIHTAIRTAIDEWESTRKNPNSKIVGIMGFSEGAIATTMLLWQKQQGQLPWLPTMHFAVLICSDFAEELAKAMRADASKLGQEKAILRLPTIHLHGRRDPFLRKGRKMVKDHFDATEAVVLEFAGGHQCPNTRADCDEAARRILNVVETAHCKQVNRPSELFARVEEPDNITNRAFSLV